MNVQTGTEESAVTKAVERMNLVSGWTDNQLSNPPPNTFLAGFRLLEERQLNEHETHELYNRVKYWGRVFKISLFITISLTSLVASYLLPLGLVPAVLLSPFVAFAFWPYWRLSKALKANRVQVFGGEATISYTDPFQGQLRKKFDFKAIKEIDYLPASDMTFLINGKHELDFVFRRQKPVVVSRAPTPRLDESLNQDELTELRGLCRTYWVGALWTTCIVPLGYLIARDVALRLIHFFKTGGNLDPRDLMVLSLILSLWLPIKAIALLFAANKLRRDVRTGTVFREGDSEFLSKSMLLWRRGGSPAEWRTAAHRPWCLDALPNVRVYQRAVGDKQDVGRNP